MKIDEMFTKIRNKKTQPQPVKNDSMKITKPSKSEDGVYSEVTGQIGTPDGASNCIPVSANPEPDLAQNDF